MRVSPYPVGSIPITTFISNVLDAGKLFFFSVTVQILNLTTLAMSIARATPFVLL